MICRCTLVTFVVSQAAFLEIYFCTDNSGEYEDCGMKVAIIGAGNVGKTIFHDLQYVNMIDEITLIGRNLDKVKAEVLDAESAAVVRGARCPRLSFGGYEASGGADILIFTAGAPNLTEDRMDLLRANCAVAETVFSEINRYNTGGLIITVTNPLDVITMKVRQLTGRNPRRVIGSGTLLESGRLTRFLAEFLEVSSRSIQLSVVGEHGASAVSLLSSIRIMGMTVEEYLRSTTGEKMVLKSSQLNEIVRNEAVKIFRGKGYTSTGISATVCRIVSAVAEDRRELLPVSTVLQGEYGVHGVAVSVPSIIGRDGVEGIPEYEMTEDERNGFLASVDVVRKAAQDAGIPV